MDMSKKAYNSPERRKRREENYSVFSRDYHNLKNKEKEEKHEGMLKRDIIERNVKECPYCHGAVHRYEHILQCEDCGAVGDLVTGIMVDMVDMVDKDKKMVGNLVIGYSKGAPEEEVKSVENLIKRGIKEGEKPRCLACSDCPMGVVGCDDDRKPHGHGSTQECPECGVPFYKVHPHSSVCTKGTPIVNNVRHEEWHMKHQLRWGGWLKNNVKDIAEILVKEPSALEVLFMLFDEGSKTVGQISNEIICDTKVTDLLDKLKKLLIIDINNDVVNITYHGKFLVRKLRRPEKDDQK